ncbi:Rrf2 family transcriptional regulator [Gryllotalpicola reticulitermitis]|uniref:Rrf2 family transcriptional regulator n=1 Tax=Gryllotalpicola reticulitermitis TaxID=1184153 RepID=A0ABV8Q9H8_9MICO
MSANSRLTIATHALTWMAYHERLGGQWTTSEQLAGSVRTNPVVIRRLMAELVKHKLLESGRGPGAGWRLARPPEQITLAQLAEALGSEPAFAMHRNEPSPICPVAQGIRPALVPIYSRVEDAIRRELEATSVADVLRDTLPA